VKARFVSFDEVVARMKGKTVAIVGSAPSVLDNEPGFIDSHEVVIRVNNYKTGERQGYRCDVHYSFYGPTGCKKSADELKRDGVTLCMCKCPDGKPIASEWHEKNGRTAGIDFRYIYQRRKDWWFCDVWVPTAHAFLEKFDLLDRHIPTTGFSAILDVLACHPASVYLTGFDFFTSGLHNVDERHRPGDPRDPIGHRPDLEAAWLAKNAHRYPLTFDKKLAQMLAERGAQLMEMAA
jgi:hypothetical protein